MAREHSEGRRDAALVGGRVAKDRCHVAILGGHVAMAREHSEGGPDAAMVGGHVAKIGARVAMVRGYSEGRPDAAVVWLSTCLGRGTH